MANGKPNFVDGTWAPFFLTAAGCGLWYLASPPLALGWVAWSAAIPWLWLVARSPPIERRGYWQIWAAASAFWLLNLQGIRLAHPALIAGWVALSVYVAVYLPLFIGLSRVAVHTLRVPLVIAAPAVWVGLELVRSNFLTGFAVALLGHTQAEYPLIIQSASLAGAYAISFLLIAAGAGAVTAVEALRSTPGQIRLALAHVAFAAALVGSAAAYGGWELSRQARAEVVADRPALRVALIQGSLDTVFEVTSERIKETFAQYHALTAQARTTHPHIDLLVWPESSCPAPYLSVKEPLSSPDPRMSAEEMRLQIEVSNQRFNDHAAAVAEKLNPAASQSPTSMILGCTSVEYGSGTSVYNSALLVGPQGKIVGRYDKMHAVMFGEYIPVAHWFPILYRLTPMGGGLTEGTSPQNFQVAGMNVSPSICFESTVPHLIRRQTAELRTRGEAPDILLNITNDGWFWGSSILDHHLRCAIFRAVELRKPLVVAANTGISAVIDGGGRVQQRGPRRQTAVLFAAVRPDGRDSLYLWWGDLPAGACGLFAGYCAFVGMRERRKRVACARQAVK